jgi:NAD(P) transhydrogenase
VQYDLIVVGAGVAGCAAALESERLGMRVLLADAGGAPGGAGLRRGTIPAATFREIVAQLSTARSMAGGTWRPDPEQLPPELLERAALRVAEGHLAALREELASTSVELLLGAAASLDSPTSVVLEGRGVLRAPHLILATGSRPRRPPRFPFDDRLVFDSDGILAARGRPRKLVVVGGEIVGCEFACLFGALGWDVTLVERRRKLIRGADRDVLDMLHASLRQLGITVSVEEQIEELEVQGSRADAHVRMRLSSGRMEIADRVLVLGGREPAVEALGLERLGIDVDAQGFIVVDENGRTSQPTIYAVGDVIGHPGRVGSGMFQGSATRRARRPLRQATSPCRSTPCPRSR